MARQLREKPAQLLLLCVLAALLAPLNAAGQQGANLDIRRCSFPPKGGNSSSVVLPLDGCPKQPETNATLAAAKANAWKFAPYLHHHPLEPYHLQVSPELCAKRSNAAAWLLYRLYKRSRRRQVGAAKLDSWQPSHDCCCGSASA
jgi:hypothetical protein